MKKVFGFLMVSFWVVGMGFGKEGEMQQDLKRKDVLELIRVTTLQPEQLDVMVPAMVYQSIGTSGVNPEEVVQEAKKLVLSDSFIGRFAAPFEERFSHEEIKLLVGFYKSDVMRKFFKSYAELLAPVYPAFSEVVQGIIKERSQDMAADRVLSVTRANFEKEVKESEIPVIVDAYSTLCAPCKKLAPIFAELSNEFGDKVKFVKLNVEGEFAISQELGIQAMPTLVFFKGGKIVEKHVGLIDKGSLADKIKEVTR